jgi:hypothetical protein
MKRIVALVIMVSTSATPGVASSSSVTVKLYATVAAGHTITFKAATANGSVPVARLQAGRYTVVVRDHSNSDNFHLFGQGVDKRTSRLFVGRQQWAVALRKGTYIFRSDARPLKTKRTFRVL